MAFAASWIPVLLTSQHELAIWQPAWPTIRVSCQYQWIYQAHRGAAGGERVGHNKGEAGVNTVEGNDFTHVG